MTTPPGQIYAGARITADMLRSIAPLAAIKGADQSVTSSTTLVNDSGLWVPVDANASYLFACYLDFEGGTQGSSDIQWTWSGPSGYTLRYASGHIGTGGTFDWSTYTGSNTVIAGTAGAGNLQAAVMLGSLVTSGAGTLQLKWAQNTASATPTIVHAQSILSLWRVA